MAVIPRRAGANDADAGMARLTRCATGRQGWGDDHALHRRRCLSVKAEAEQVSRPGCVCRWCWSAMAACAPANPFVSLMIVPEGPDVADKWIAEHCRPGDVVVTADIPAGGSLSQGRAQVVSSMTARCDAGQYRRPAGDARPDAGHPQRQPLSSGQGGVSKTDARFLQSLDRVMAAALRVANRGARPLCASTAVPDQGKRP